MNADFISFAALMPHAPILVPNVGGEHVREVEETCSALVEVGRRAAATAAETLVVLSPHSPYKAGAVSIWRTSPLHGSFAAFGARSERVELPLDAELADRLAEECGRRSLATWDIKRGSLDHGAMVPLYHLIAAGWDRPACIVGLGELDDRKLDDLGDAIAAAAAGLQRHIVLIASGDMSHRLTATAPYGYAPEGERFDQAFIDLLATGTPDAIRRVEPALRGLAAEDVVAPTRIALAATAFSKHGREVLSYEGPFGVGYGVAILSDRTAAPATPAGPVAGAVLSDIADLPQVARQSVAAVFAGGPELAPYSAAGPLTARRGVFVTLHTAEDELRGCRGAPLSKDRDLVASTWAHAREAAFDDPRFPPLKAADLPNLRFTVSILGELERVHSPAGLDPARYGVLVSSKDGVRRGLLLPGLKAIATAEDQVRMAQAKAGIAAHEPVALYRFTTQTIEELVVPETRGLAHAP